MVIFKNCPSVLSLSLIHCHLSAASPNHNLISAVTVTPTAVHQLQALQGHQPHFLSNWPQCKAWYSVLDKSDLKRFYHNRGHESLFMIRLQQRARCKPPVSPHARHLLCWACEHDIQATITWEINLMTVQSVCLSLSDFSSTWGYVLYGSVSILKWPKYKYIYDIFLFMTETNI